MEAVSTELDGVWFLQPRRHGDERGWFQETWSAATLSAIGIEETFCQDNESMSAEPGTVRGLHFQADPSAQGKLVRVVSGSVLDVAVDLRTSSTQFGQHVTRRLTASGGEQLWVPTGFAHGFQTLEPNTIVAYKVTTPYDPTAERVLRFDDPALGIEWAMARDEATVNDRDGSAPLLSELVTADGVFA